MLYNRLDLLFSEIMGLKEVVFDLRMHYAVFIGTRLVLQSTAASAVEQRTLGDQDSSTDCQGPTWDYAKLLYEMLCSWVTRSMLEIYLLEKLTFIIKTADVEHVEAAFHSVLAEDLVAEQQHSEADLETWQRLLERIVWNGRN